MRYESSGILPGVARALPRPVSCVHIACAEERGRNIAKGPATKLYCGENATTSGATTSRHCTANVRTSKNRGKLTDCDRVARHLCGGSRFPSPGRQPHRRSRDRRGLIRGAPPGVRPAGERPAPRRKRDSREVTNTFGGKATAALRLSLLAKLSRREYMTRYFGSVDVRKEE
jgi:hypothetical protein